MYPITAPKHFYRAYFMSRIHILWVHGHLGIPVQVPALAKMKLEFMTHKSSFQSRLADRYTALFRVIMRA